MAKKHGIKIAPIKSIPGTKRRRKPDKIVAPEITLEKTEDEKRETLIFNQIGAHPGDEKVARRIVKLEKQFSRSTIPELVAYEWLERQEENFWYQPEVMGGRVKGGMLPDFVVGSGSKGVAWLVQGSYYHGAQFQRMAGQQGRDVEAELKLRGKYVGGVRIEIVVPLSEKDIYNRRPQIFLRAMSGELIG